MKKLHTLSFIAFLFITGAANAQINKGATFLGGDIGGSFGSSKHDGAKVDDWHNVFFSPVFGKAIRQNLILGGDLAFGFSESSVPSNPRTKTTTYGAGIFLRKYGQLGKSGFSLFVQGRLGGAYQTNKRLFIDNKFTQTSITLSAYPGISYRVNRRLHLETGFNNLLNFGYSRTKNTFGGSQPSTDISRSFNFNTSLNNLSSLYAGFRLLLDK